MTIAPLGTIVSILCLATSLSLGQSPNDLKTTAPAAADPLVRTDDAVRCTAAGEKDCRIHWRDAFLQAGELLAIVHVGNRSAYGTELRGKFFPRWIDAVSKQRLSVWNDGDPFVYDYVAHPVTGAIVGSILLQNDPKARQIGFENSRRYWASRGKAMAFAALYEVQWEIGPASEASLEHVGSYHYISQSSGRWTNGTGLTDYVMTPVGGAALIVAEDLIYTHLQARMLSKRRNPAARFAISLLTPNRSVANLLRWHAPWSRE
jgi:hypothetical protein